MSAFERKCVHDVINSTTGVESESEGVERAAASSSAAV
jgi:spoIIIJ-associated protein